MMRPRKVNIKTREEIMKNFTREFLVEEKRRCEIDRYITDFRILIHKRPHENHNYLNRLLQDYTTMFLAHERMNVNKANESEMKYQQKSHLQSSRKKESPKKRYVKTKLTSSSRSNEHESYLVLKAKTLEFLKKLREYERLEQIAYEIYMRHNDQSYHRDNIDNENVIKFKSDIPVEIPYKKHVRNVYVVNEPKSSKGKPSDNPLENYTFIKDETQKFLNDNRNYNENERKILSEQYQNNAIIKKYVDSLTASKKQKETTPKKGIISRIKNMMGISPADAPQKLEPKAKSPSYILETMNFLLNEKTYANYEFESYKLFYIKQDQFENPLIEKIKEIAYDEKSCAKKIDTPGNRRKITIKNLVSLKSSKANSNENSPKEKEEFETFNVVKCSPPGNSNTNPDVKFQFADTAPVLPVEEQNIRHISLSTISKNSNTNDEAIKIRDQTREFLLQQRTYDGIQKEFTDKFYETHSFLPVNKENLKKESLLNKIKQFFRIGKGGKPKEKAQFFKEITQNFLTNEQYYNDSLREAPIEFNDNFSIPITNTPNIRLKKKQFKLELSPREKKRLRSQEKFDDSPTKLHQRSRSEDMLLFRTKSKSLDRKSPTSFKTFSERLKNMVGIGNRRRTKSRENITRLTDPVQYFLDHERYNYDIDPEISKKYSKNYTAKDGSMKMKTRPFLSHENIVDQDKNDGITSKPPTGRRPRKRSDQTKDKRRSRTLSPAQKLVSKVRNLIHGDPKKKEKDNFEVSKKQTESFLEDHKRFNDFQKEEFMKSRGEPSSAKQIATSVVNMETQKPKSTSADQKNGGNVFENPKFVRDQTGVFLHETKKYHDLDKEPNNLNKTLIFVNNKSDPSTSFNHSKIQETFNTSSFEERAQKTEKVSDKLSSTETKQSEHQKKDDFTKTIEKQSISTDQSGNKIVKQIIRNETKVVTKRVVSETVQKKSTNFAYPKNDQVDQIDGEISEIRNLATNINTKIEVNQCKMKEFRDEAKKIHDEEQAKLVREETGNFLKTQIYEKEIKKKDPEIILIDELHVKTPQVQKIDPAVHQQVLTELVHGKPVEISDIKQKKMESKVTTETKTTPESGLKKDKIPKSKLSKLKSVLTGSSKKPIPNPEDEILRNQTQEFLKKSRDYDRQQQDYLSRQNIVWLNGPSAIQEEVLRPTSSNGKHSMKIPEAKITREVIPVEQTKTRRAKIFGKPKIEKSDPSVEENQKLTREFIDHLRKYEDNEKNYLLTKKINWLSDQKPKPKTRTHTAGKIPSQEDHEMNVQIMKSNELFLNNHQEYHNRLMNEHVNFLRKIGKPEAGFWISSKEKPKNKSLVTKVKQLLSSNKLAQAEDDTAKNIELRKATEEFLKKNRYRIYKDEIDVNKTPTTSKSVAEVKSTPPKEMELVQIKDQQNKKPKLQKIKSLFSGTPRPTATQGTQEKPAPVVDHHTKEVTDGFLRKQQYLIHKEELHEPKVEPVMESPSAYYQNLDVNRMKILGLMKDNKEFLIDHQEYHNRDRQEINDFYKKSGKPVNEVWISSKRKPKTENFMGKVKRMFSPSQQTAKTQEQSVALKSQTEEFLEKQQYSIFKDEIENLKKPEEIVQKKELKLQSSEIPSYSITKNLNESFLADHQDYHNKQREGHNEFLMTIGKPDQEIWLSSKPSSKSKNLLHKVKNIFTGHQKPHSSISESDGQLKNQTETFLKQNQYLIHGEEVVALKKPTDPALVKSAKIHQLQAELNEEDKKKNAIIMNNTRIFLKDHQEYHGKERENINEFIKKFNKPENEIWLSSRASPKRKNLLGKVKDILTFGHSKPVKDEHEQNQTLRDQTAIFIEKQKYTIHEDEIKNLKIVPADEEMTKTKITTSETQVAPKPRSPEKVQQEVKKKKGTFSKIKSLLNTSKAQSSKESDEIIKEQTQLFLTDLKNYSDVEKEVSSKHNIVWLEEHFPIKESVTTESSAPRNNLRKDHQAHLALVRNTDSFLKDHQDYHNKQRNEDNSFYSRVGKPEMAWLATNRKPEKKNLLSKVKNLFSTPEKHSENNAIFYDDAAALEAKQNELLRDDTKKFLDNQQYLIHPEEYKFKMIKEVKDQPKKKVTFLQSGNQPENAELHKILVKQTEDFLKDHKDYHDQQMHHYRNFSSNQVETTASKTSKTPILSNIKSLFSKPTQKDIPQVQKDFLKVMRDESSKFLDNNQYMIHPEEITELSKPEEAIKHQSSRNPIEYSEKSQILIQNTDEFLKDHQNYHDNQWSLYKQFITKQGGDKQKMKHEKKPILAKVKSLFSSNHQSKPTISQAEREAFVLGRKQSDEFLKKHQGYLIYSDEITQNKTKPTVTPRKSKSPKEEPTPENFEDKKRNLEQFLHDHQLYHNSERKEFITYNNKVIQKKLTNSKAPVKEQKSKSKLMTKLKSLVGGSQENLNTEKKHKSEHGLMRKHTTEFLISQKCYSDLEAEAANNFALFKKVPQKHLENKSNRDRKIVAEKSSSMVPIFEGEQLNESSQKLTDRPQYSSAPRKDSMMDNVLLTVPQYSRTRKPSYIVESEKIDYEFTHCITKMFLNDMRNHHDTLQYDNANYTPKAPPRKKSPQPQEKKENIVKKIRTKILPNTNSRNRSYDVQKAETVQTTPKKEVKKEKPKSKKDQIIMTKLVETHEIPGVENDSIVRNQTDLFLKDHQDYHDKERCHHVTHFGDSFPCSNLKEKKTKKGMVSKLKSLVTKDPPNRKSTDKNPEILTKNQTKEFLDHSKEYTHLEKIAEDEFEMRRSSLIITDMDSSPTSYRRRAPVQNVQIKEKLPETTIQVQPATKPHDEEHKTDHSKPQDVTKDKNVHGKRTKILSTVPSLNDCEPLGEDEKKNIESLVIERVVSPLSPTKTVFREIRSREDSSPDRRIYILNEGYTKQKDVPQEAVNVKSPNIQTKRVEITTKSHGETNKNLPTIYLQTTTTVNRDMQTLEDHQVFSFNHDFIQKERAHVDQDLGQKHQSSSEPLSPNQRESTSNSSTKIRIDQSSDYRKNWLLFLIIILVAIIAVYLRKLSNENVN